MCGNAMMTGDIVGPIGGWYLLGLDGHFSDDDRYLDRLEFKVISP